MKVSLFISCCLDQFSPQTAVNFVTLLNNLGVETYYNNKQTCCGQVFYKTGNEQASKQLGDTFISLFSNKQYIVGCSSSCVSHIKFNFNKIFENTINNAFTKNISESIYDVTDFIVSVLKIEKVNASFPHKAVFMDNCVALREYKLYEQPRILLKNITDIELLELPCEETCCGYGGVFSLHYEAISTAMAKQKVENAMSVGAEYIISTDAACLLHLQSYISKHKLPVKCIHIVDVLTAGL